MNNWLNEVRSKLKELNDYDLEVERQRKEKEFNSKTKGKLIGERIFIFLFAFPFFMLSFLKIKNEALTSGESLVLFFMGGASLLLMIYQIMMMIKTLKVGVIRGITLFKKEDPQVLTRCFGFLFFLSISVYTFHGGFIDGSLFNPSNGGCYSSRCPTEGSYQFSSFLFFCFSLVALLMGLKDYRQVKRKNRP